MDRTLLFGWTGGAYPDRICTAESSEESFFERMPGYSLIRSLTHRLAGEDREVTWKPALAEVEEALVPAFIIEELGDGRFTVFVPL